MLDNKICMFTIDHFVFSLEEILIFTVHFISNGYFVVQKKKYIVEF